MPARVLSFLWGREKPNIYEMVITQDGLSLEGNEKLGAHIEDILKYVEKKAEDLGLEERNIEIYIKNGSKTIAIKRMGGLGVAVVSSTIEEAQRALRDVEGRVDELLADRYEESMREFRKTD
ncbi:hypothetical protein [Thermococcus sp.]|uniref:hypothetical protein n=1 Tax=Thermococcus sp. TaxID=35749 RepID=UPI0026124E94|nr:hypothetical protein [Thermococcus sp.]